MNLYLVGSLRNPRIPELSNKLRDLGFEVFSDWFAAGPEADDYWRDYEKSQGRTLPEALKGPAAQNVFHFDRDNLYTSSVVVLVMPAGKSAHLELGWALGAGKWGYILLEDEPERWDVMANFAHGVFFTFEELAKELTCLLQSVTQSSL